MYFASTTSTPTRATQLVLVTWNRSIHYKSLRKRRHKNMYEKDINFSNRLIFPSCSCLEHDLMLYTVSIMLVQVLE